MVRPPAFADATSSTGFSRMVTVELLLMRVLLCAKRPMLRNNNAAKQPCYTRRRGRDPTETEVRAARHPPQVGAASTIDRKPRRLCEVGAKPTRSRHCKRLAARQNDVTGTKKTRSRRRPQEKKQSLRSLRSLRLLAREDRP